MAAKWEPCERTRGVGGQGKGGSCSLNGSAGTSLQLAAPTQARRSVEDCCDQSRVSAKRARSAVSVLWVGCQLGRAELARAAFVCSSRFELRRCQAADAMGAIRRLWCCADSIGVCAIAGCSRRWALRGVEVCGGWPHTQTRAQSHAYEQCCQPQRLPTPTYACSPLAMWEYVAQR